jgi:hypothetical protein
LTARKQLWNMINSDTDQSISIDELSQNGHSTFVVDGAMRVAVSFLIGRCCFFVFCFKLPKTILFFFFLFISRFVSYYIK